MDPLNEQKIAEQVDKVTQLQDFLLDDFIRLCQSGQMTSTDRAVLYRMLRDNGWSLDPAKLPQSVKNLLTREVQFDDDLEGDTKMRLIG